MSILTCLYRTKYNGINMSLSDVKEYIASVLLINLIHVQGLIKDYVLYLEAHFQLSCEFFS